MKQENKQKIEQKLNGDSTDIARIIALSVWRLC